MKTILLSLSAACILSAATDPQAIVNEVTKLRQKYEECRAGQSVVQGIEPKLYNECKTDKSALETKVKGYQKRIAYLEDELKKTAAKASASQKSANACTLELGQKKGVITSLEQTLSARDQDYREASAKNKNLTAQLHTQLVNKQEREMLKKALVSAKEELAAVQKQLNGGSSSVSQLREELKQARITIAQLQKKGADTQAATVQKSGQKESEDKIRALQTQLASANTALTQLRSAQPKVQIQEKIVTKVVEPTEKIQALQRELSAAQTTIANLKSSNSKVVYKDRIVTQEKVVYKDRPVEKIVTKTVQPTEQINALQAQLKSANAQIAQLKNSKSKVQVQEKVVEKVVYKDRIVTQEKVVYKDRPVEKIVTKTVEPTEKIKALQAQLNSANARIAQYQNAKPNVQVQEKIVEKIVYKDKPVEKIVIKQDEAMKRQLDKLSLELERSKSLNMKLSRDLETAQSKRSATTTIAKASAVSAPAAKLKPIAKPDTAIAAKASVVTAASVASATNTAKKSSAYRMASNAPIYNAPGGRQIDTWEARRSFTAGNPSGGWVHITGYFVNRVWQATKEDENLYVKESDVIRR